MLNVWKINLRCCHMLLKPKSFAKFLKLKLFQQVLNGQCLSVIVSGRQEYKDV